MGVRARVLSSVCSLRCVSRLVFRAVVGASRVTRLQGAKCSIVLGLVEGKGEASWNEGGRYVIEWWRGGSNESWSYVATGKTGTGLAKPLPGP